MKSNIVIFILILLVSVIIVSGCIGSASPPPLENENISGFNLSNCHAIDSEVFTTLSAQSEVEVTVILKDTGNTENNRQIQSEILSNLSSQEFKSPTKDLDGRFFGGLITEKGLVKFCNNSHIQRVYIPQPLEPLSGGNNE